MERRRYTFNWWQGRFFIIRHPKLQTGTTLRYYRMMNGCFHHQAPLVGVDWFYPTNGPLHYNLLIHLLLSMSLHDLLRFGSRHLTAIFGQVLAGDDRRPTTRLGSGRPWCGRHAVKSPQARKPLAPRPRPSGPTDSGNAVT